MHTIKFLKVDRDIKFLTELRTKVNQYFKQNNITKHANRFAMIKAVILLVIYISASLSLFLVGSFPQLILVYAVIGVFSIFIALNISHDAAHNSFSKSNKLNRILVYTFDMMGASGYIWKHKHIYSHHPHVNIPEVDNDIKQSKLVRIFPNAPWLSNHRYQHIYMPVLYLFYTLFWMLVRDFRDFFETNADGNRVFNHEKKQYALLFLVKMIFVGRMLIIPFLVLPFTFGQVLIGFLSFHLIASFTVALPLVSAHVGEHAQFPEPDDNGLMPSSWVRHQLVTTTDFATENLFLTHLFGGFNHHVVHHLFPDISYAHYPQLTRILKETCKEYNMPYEDNPSMLTAVWSHLKFLRMQGQYGLQVAYIDM